ncbi:MAG: hypothetical protein U1D97_00895 [Desulfuromonadales bacterium]|nr:hypothetical protein [Desulfuromonadales bacterium]
MRKSDLFFVVTAINLTLLAGVIGHALVQAGRADSSLHAGRELAKTLQLTDLALFTEARYTRHPSQADRHAPFQDHPMALDHFPSGSFLRPPLPSGGL